MDNRILVFSVYYSYFNDILVINYYVFGFKGYLPIIPKLYCSGADCMDAFMGMQKCLQSYPELYKDDDAAVDVDQEENDQSQRKKT